MRERPVACRTPESWLPGFRLELDRDDLTQDVLPLVREDERRGTRSSNQAQSAEMLQPPANGVFGPPNLLRDRDGTDATGRPHHAKDARVVSS